MARRVSSSGGRPRGREERRTREDLRSKKWTWQRRAAGATTTLKQVYQQADPDGDVPCGVRTSGVVVGVGCELLWGTHLI